MEKSIKYSILIFILSIISVNAQQPVQWLNNENFSISSDQYTITHNPEKVSAHLISKQYLDANEDGYIQIYNLEDLKDFSVYLEAEDKLGNTVKSYGLLFNHILDESPTDNNQSMDSIIALKYSKYKLEKTTSKDGEKELKTRDFKIFDHGKLMEELDDPKAPIAIPFDYAKSIRIEKVGDQILIKKNGEILKTINDVLQVRYRIAVHSYLIDSELVNQISIDTNFSNTSETVGRPSNNNRATNVNISCVNSNLDLDHNWTTKCSYDVTGRVIGSRILYSDNFGKPEQEQTIDIKTGKVWMSQPIYDSQGRAMFSSASAPIGSNFGFKTDFIKKTDGSVLTRADLEANMAPPLGDFANTLGQYYSENNDLSIPGSEYQDVSSYPYSRSVFSELNPGAVLKTVGGKKIDFNNNGITEWKQGFSYTVPASQELYYIFGKEYFNNYSDVSDINGVNLEEDQFTQRYIECDVILYDANCEFDLILSQFHLRFQSTFLPENGKFYKFGNNSPVSYMITNATIAQDQTTNSSLNILPYSFDTCEIASLFNTYYDLTNSNNHFVSFKAYKTVSVDINGNESVVFTNAEGKALAVGRGGDVNNQQEVLSLIGEQGFIDIHISKNTDGNISFLGNVSDYKAWDLKTELEVLDLSQPFSPGFYRIQALDNRYKNKPALTYIDANNHIQPIFPSSNMGVRYHVNYYDFAVNYYDKSGKLKETVQPLGFDNNNLVNKTFNSPNHTMVSTFKYNSIGQLLEATSPDEGQSKFKYRRDGQIRFSQNEKQSALGEVSYTNYDNLGRPIESGVVTANFNTLNPNTNGYSGNKKEQNFTFYNVADANLLDANGNYVLANVIPANSLADLLNQNDLPPSKYQQSFLASNVSVTYARPLPNEPITNVTWYSYDIYGRVKWVVQYIDGLGIKTIDYVYDPVTSNVNEVIYQKYNYDEYFAHTYEYDDDTNKLIKVATSHSDMNGMSATKITTQHVEYSYYENGALKRTQYAKQGVDYVYNLSGQLKSINHPSLNQANDPGGDPNDLFGLTIDYYNGDYTRTNTPTPIETTPDGTNQYNGNIKALRWKTQGLPVPDADAQDDTNAQLFTYNDNFWLTKAEFGVAYQANAHILPSTNDHYKVFGIDYDKNGNILHLNRNAVGASNAMDRLTYHYKQNSNQLRFVDDAVTQNTGLDDIKDQAPNNYIYNSIGQLITNNQDGIIYEYNASGLVTQINKFNPATHGYNTIYENDYNKVEVIEEILVEEHWFCNKPFIQNFEKEENITINGNNYSIFCKELAKKQRQALGFRGSDIIEVSRQMNLETDGEYIVSFDALLKSPELTGGQSINLDIHILDDRGDIIAETNFYSSGNSPFDYINYCDMYQMLPINLSFTATTDIMYLEIKASLEHGSIHEFSFAIDNFKIQKFTTETALKFYYDDKGKRIRKEVFSNNGNTRKITYYVRDVSGSAMAIYSNTITTGQTPPQAILEEQSVYGLGRLGVYKKKIAPDSHWDGYTYQLTDHLGNVRATFINLDNLLVAKVTNATDYYPFGMPMPNRHIQDANNYRYAYQGQEKDPETGKEAFELRLWDSRIGRWITIDPYGQYFSPYLGMGNNPVSMIDPDGGCTDCTACPEACLTLNIIQVPEGKGISYDFDTDSYSLVQADFANLLNTVILGDMSVNDFVGVQGQIEFFFPTGQNPILYVDRLKKQQWKGIWLMTSMVMEIGSFISVPSGSSNIMKTRRIVPRISQISHNSDFVIESSRRVVKGRTPRGIQALSKKINRNDEVYKGLKVNQENVNKIIRNIMDNPHRLKHVTRNQQGEKVVDYYNIFTKQGIRMKNGQFDTFLTY